MHHHLTYRRASASWLDRLPLGNGRLGAMVGADTVTRRIGLNESSAWSGGVASAEHDLVDPAAAAVALADARAAIAAGRPGDAERALEALQHGYAQAYLPVGELVVRTSIPDAARELSIVRDLDLETGVHTVHAPRVLARTLVSSAYDVVSHSEHFTVPTDVRIELETPHSVRRSAWGESGARMLLELPADVAPTHEPAAAARTQRIDGIIPITLAAAFELRHDGDAVADARSVTVHGARRIEVVLTITSTFTAVGAAPGDSSVALATAAALLAAAPDDLLAEQLHEASGNAFSLRLGGPAVAGDPDARVARAADSAAPVTVSDPRLLEMLVAFGVHLLRASSRAGGLPANLQGIWNAEMQAPWSSAYTLNINTQMNAWAAEAVGHSGANLAILELLEGLALRGADTAARLYGARGWVAHHNSDAWGYSLPTNGDASWAQWALGGAWLVRQFDEHRRHGAETAETAARFWPIARGCAEFLLDWLVEIDGALATRPSTSPENRFFDGGGVASLTTSSALDRALIADVFEVVVERAKLLDLHDEVADAAAAALARIEGPRLDASGRVAEWGEDRVDEDPHHRHVSHLYPWFPGAGDQGDERDAAAARTLDARGDDSTGWSLVWKLALRARLGDRDAVDRLLRLVVRPAGGDDPHRGGLYPNLFAAHPPFQIDGNLGFVAAFLETIVQSHRPGRIDLLPALPTALAEGEVHGLIARPGLVIDLAWANATPRSIRVHARTPEAAGAYTFVHGDVARVHDVPPVGALDLSWGQSASSPTSSDRSAS